MNLLINELVREAEHQQNTLALEIAKQYENDLEELKAEFEEPVNELVEFYVDKIKAQFEAFCDDYYSNAESDYWPEYDYLLIDSDLNDDISRVLDEILRDSCLGQYRTLEKNQLDFLENNVGDVDFLEKLEQAIKDDIGNALSLEITGMYRSASYSIYSAEVPEQIDDDISSWVDRVEVPYCLTERVKRFFDDHKTNLVWYSGDAVYWCLHIGWLDDYITRLINEVNENE
jgi:hypothetical protein